MIYEVFYSLVVLIGKLAFFNKQWQGFIISSRPKDQRRFENNKHVIGLTFMSYVDSEKIKQANTFSDLT